MFCPRCGKENRDAGDFCIYCGNRLPTSGSASGAGAASNRAPQAGVEHDISHMTLDAYRKLGGWLAFLSYGRLLSAVLELVICIVVTFFTTCFEYHQNGSRIFVGFYNFAKVAGSRIIQVETIICCGGLFAIILYVLFVCCSIVMHQKIKARKANCISFYRGVAVIISCGTIAVLLVAYMLVRRNPGIIRSRFAMMQIMSIAGTAVWLLLDMVISFLIFSAYFKSSKRVKVYFETKQ